MTRVTDRKMGIRFESGFSPRFFLRLHGVCYRAHNNLSTRRELSKNCSDLLSDCCSLSTSICTFKFSRSSYFTINVIKDFKSFGMLPKLVYVEKKKSIKEVASSLVLKRGHSSTCLVLGTR